MTLLSLLEIGVTVFLFRCAVTIEDPLFQLGFAVAGTARLVGGRWSCDGVRRWRLT